MPDLPAIDTAPKNGKWVEHFDLVLTDEEIALGNEDGKKVHDKVANVQPSDR